MDDTRETVRQKLRQILEKNDDTRGFSDTDSLVFSGRFESLDVLEIALFLESRFGLDLSEGFDLSRLDSVEEIMNLLGSART
jgi:acyl carrier protein